MYCMKRELKKERTRNAGVEETSISGIGVLLESIDQIFLKNSNLVPYSRKIAQRIPRKANIKGWNVANRLKKGQNRLTSHKWQKPK